MENTMNLIALSSVIPLDQIDFASIYAQIILKQSDRLLYYYEEMTAIDRKAPKLKISLQKAKVLLLQSQDDIRQYLLYLIANQHIDASQASMILKAYHQLHDFNDLLLFQEFLLLNALVDAQSLNQMLTQFIQKQFLDLFSLETGVIVVKAFQPVSDVIHLPLSPVRLLIQGVQKNYSKAKLYALKCTFESIVSKAEFSVWESELYPSERTLLSLAQSKSIAELIDASHLEPRFALALSYALLLLGELYFDQEMMSEDQQEMNGEAIVQAGVKKQPTSHSDASDLISAQLSLQGVMTHDHTMNPKSTPLEYTIHPSSQPVTAGLPIRLKQANDLNQQLVSQESKRIKEVNDLKLIHQIALSENYFKILNVSFECQVEQVHKHWLFLKQKLEKSLNHPAVLELLSREDIKNIALIIDDAYRVLSDQRLKEIYLNGIKASAP